LKILEQYIDKILDNMVGRLEGIPILHLLTDRYLRIVVAKIVDIIDSYVPDEIITLALSASDGLDAEELQEIGSNLTDFINKHVDIPIVGEQFERIIISQVVNVFTENLAKGLGLDEDV
jgi:hypothetical protein